MNILTPDNADFLKTMTQVCELIPRLRFIAKDVYKIEKSPQGMRFLNAKDEQIAVIGSKTLKQAKEDFSATFQH